MAETGLFIDKRSAAMIRKFPEVIAPALAKAMEAGVKRGEQYAKNYVYGDSGLTRRSGQLGRSLKGTVNISGGHIQGKLTTDAVHAPTHEHGATIVPKRVQWLTIPTEFAKTAAGVTRGGARTFSNTFFLKPGKGRTNPLIMQKQGKEVIPLFVLKKSVTIPARPFMRPSAMQTKKYIEEEIPKRIKRAMKGGT